MEIKDKIYEIVSRRMKRNVYELSDDTNFKKDLGADSIDTVEIIFELEEMYGISIEDTDAEMINTVGDAVSVIQRIVAEG